MNRKQFLTYAGALLAAPVVVGTVATVLSKNREQIKKNREILDRFSVDEDGKLHIEGVVVVGDDIMIN